MTWKEQSVVWLRANQYSGSGDWLDESGNDFHVSPLNGAEATWQGDHFDLNLDSIGQPTNTGLQHFRRLYTAALNTQLTGDLTVVFVVRPKDFTARVGIAETSYQSEFNITQEPTTAFNFYNGLEAAPLWSGHGQPGSVPGLQLNQWHSVAIGRDMSLFSFGGIFFQSNGIRAINTTQGLQAGQPYVNNLNNLLIARSHVGGYRGSYAGIGIFNQVLTTAQADEAADELMQVDTSVTASAAAPSTVVAAQQEATIKLTVEAPYAALGTPHSKLKLVQEYER